MLRVALLRDFDEARLFGVRLYAERLRATLMSRCELVDVRPWPLTARGPRVLRLLETFVVKELIYPLAVRRVAADVLHVVDQSHAPLVRALRGRATVVTCHDLWGLRHGGRLRRFLYRRRVRSLIQATRVVAVSEATRRAAIGLGVESGRIVVVRNRVDPFFVSRPAADEIRATADRLGVEPGGFFLHVGSSLPYKNIERLMQALAEVGRASMNTARLVKVGAPLTPRQRRLAAELGVVVRCLGEVSAADLRALYHLASCLVYPSLDEGFGWPVAEALACGLPVVAGRSGALPEVAGEAALFVDPTQTAELVDALVRLASRADLREELEARGRARGEWLSQGDVGAELLEVYGAAIRERSAGCGS